MTLEELLNLKVIYENVRVVDLDTTTDNCGLGLHAYAEALRVFNRPVEKYDFKGHDTLVKCLSKNVVAVFAGESKYKTIIQVSNRKKVQDDK